MTNIKEKQKLAEEFVQLKSWEQAIDLYLEIGKEYPNVPDSFIQVGFIYLTLSRFSEASNIAKFLIANFPDHPESSYLDLCCKANKKMGHQHWTEAIELFQKAESILPKLAHPLIRQGEIYLTLNQSDHLDLITKKLTARFPENPNRFLLQAKYLTNQEKWSEAFSIYQEASQKFPVNSYFIIMQCLCLYKLARIEDARALIHSNFGGVNEIQTAYIPALVDVIFKNDDFDFLLGFYEKISPGMPIESSFWEQKIDFLTASSQIESLGTLLNDLKENYQGSLRSLRLQEKILIKLQHYQAACSVIEQIYTEHYQANNLFLKVHSLVINRNSKKAMQHVRQFLQKNSIRLNKLTRYDEIIFQRLECAAIFEEYERHKLKQSSLPPLSAELGQVSNNIEEYCYSIFLLANESIKQSLSTVFPVETPISFNYKNEDLDRPIELSDSFTRFNLNTSPGLSEGTPSVVKLKNVRSFGNNRFLFDQSGSPLEVSMYLNDSSLYEFSSLTSTLPTQDEFSKASYQEVDEVVLFGGHFFISNNLLTANYGHSIVGNLSRLWYLVQNQFAGKILIFLQYDDGFIDDFMFELLELLNIPKDRLIIANQKYYHFKEMIVPYPTVAFTNHFYKGAKIVFDQIAKNGSKIPTTHSVKELGEVENVYISYSSLGDYYPTTHAPNRKILNELELIEKLKTYNFTIIDPMKYNEFEIHQILNAAKSIVVAESSAAYGFVHLLKETKIVTFETVNASLFYAFFFHLLGLEGNIYADIFKRIKSDTPQTVYAQGVYEIDIEALLDVLETEKVIEKR